MSAPRKSDQTLAKDIALAVFKQGGFHPLHAGGIVLRMEEIVEAMEKYEPRTLGRIVASAPNLLVDIPAWSYPMGALLQRLAATVIADQIQRIVGAEPRFGHPAWGDWIFLGGSLRNPTELPLTPLQKGTPQENDTFVDLWGRTDGQVVLVFYAGGNTVGHIDNLDEAGGHVREAFRRLALARAVAA